MTASSLLKVNPDGSVVDQGSTNLGVNKAGMLLHSAIHGARKDARAIMHLHQDAIVAVSSKLQFRKPVFRPATFVVFALFYTLFFFFFRQSSLDYNTSCRYALHIFALSISLWAKLPLFILFPDLVEISIED